MAESKNYLAEFGSTQTGGGRVFLIDIYEHWNKEKSKPVGLVTTFFHHNVKNLLYDARKHISKAQAKRCVECVRNRQSRMVIAHTGFALWGGNIYY